MYQTHFHLTDRPFASAPNPEHYFPACSIEQAREVISLNVERAAGVTLLMGSVGSGKTLLCQLMANHFSGELPVCMLPGERIRDLNLLLQAILHRLGLPFRDQNDGELRLTLTNHVTGPACPKGILLIVDEADRLPLELLEEVRVITNLVQDGKPRVRLVLAGAPRLEERVGHPRLESLNQRVVGRLHLENFSEDETAEYIKARLTSCGGDAPSIFTEAALNTVYRATAGVPRLINQVCDHALLMSAVGDSDRLDGELIEEAWADLQQLPIPPGSLHDRKAASDEPSVVVEFGSLDDDDAMVSAYAQLDELQQVVATLNEENEDSTIEIAGDIQLEDTVEISGDFEMESEFVIAGNFEIESEDAEHDSQIDMPVMVGDSAEVEGGNSTDEPVAVDSIGELDASPAVISFGEIDKSTRVDPSVDFEASGNYPSDEYGEFESAIEPEEAPSVSSLVDDQETFFESVTVSEDDTDIDVQVDDEVAPESDDERAVIEAAGGEAMEMTIEQAVNPFDEEFAEEELVIQEFASPSRLARQGQEYVTSGYSRHLAKQLSAAHPGLRMHTFDDVPSWEADEPTHGFRPLSAYMLDERDDTESDNDDASEITIKLEADHFDPSSDPVLPESAVTGLASDTNVTAGDEVMFEYDYPGAEEQTPPEVEIAIARATETSNSTLPEATIVMDGEIESRPPQARKKRVFRRLFSSMRRS